MKVGDTVLVNVGIYVGSPVEWSLANDGWHRAKILDGPNGAGQFYVSCIEEGCGHTPGWVFQSYINAGIDSRPEAPCKPKT